MSACNDVLLLLQEAGQMAQCELVLYAKQGQNVPGGVTALNNVESIMLSPVQCHFTTVYGKGCKKTSVPLLLHPWAQPWFWS